MDDQQLMADVRCRNQVLTKLAADFTVDIREIRDGMAAVIRAMAQRRELPVSYWKGRPGDVQAREGEWLEWTNIIRYPDEWCMIIGQLIAGLRESHRKRALLKEWRGMVRDGLEMKAVRGMMDRLQEGETSKPPGRKMEGGTSAGNEEETQSNNKEGAEANEGSAGRVGRRARAEPEKVTVQRLIDQTWKEMAFISGEEDVNTSNTCSVHVGKEAWDARMKAGQLAKLARWWQPLLKITSNRDALWAILMLMEATGKVTLDPNMTLASLLW